MRVLAAVAAGLVSAFVLTSVNQAFAASALSQAAKNTRYKSYYITGDTAGEVLISMIRRGPTVGGVKAYATTLADFKQSGTMLGNSQSCRVRQFSFDGRFTITLPKLRNEGAMTGSSRAAWNQFFAFLKTHEEKHRSLWVGCAQRFERQVAGLTGRTCNDIEKKAKKLWDNVRNSCRKLHDAHDARDQAALLRQPLVHMALSSHAIVRKNERPLRPIKRAQQRRSVFSAE